MKYRNIRLLALLFLLCCPAKLWAQGKMLTIDDKAVMAKAEEYRAKVAKSLSGN